MTEEDDEVCLVTDILLPIATKFLKYVVVPSLLLYFIASPFIHIYMERMSGKAELARAEYNRQITIFEAHAKKESAKELAEAEIIRAEGVAKANMIIGESLKNNESYLRYLWVQSLNTHNAQVIYVPTEANVPILESQRLSHLGGSSEK